MTKTDGTLILKWNVKTLYFFLHIIHLKEKIS